MQSSTGRDHTVPFAQLISPLSLPFGSVIWRIHPCILGVTHLRKHNSFLDGKEEAIQGLSHHLACTALYGSP
jgi:hypothetical protein